MIVVVLPAAWAPALVNGDWSIEYTDPDQALEAKAWQMTSGLSVLSCSDMSFTARYNGILAECLVYYCLPLPKWEEVAVERERLRRSRRG